MSFDFPVISADSHVTEAPNAYVDYVDPSFRARAPRLVDGGPKGDVFEIEGMKALNLGTAAAAGKRPEEIKAMGARFDELHRSGWDSSHRLADQDRDGVAAEVIYPSLGMLLCNHPDRDYMDA